MAIGMGQALTSSMLPLWFKNAADYDKISGTDKISILGLNSFQPGKDIEVEITHKDGKKEKILTTSSINAGQWEWFKAGSGEPKHFVRSSHC
jgi:aconitate hydratase